MVRNLKKTFIAMAAGLVALMMCLPGGTVSRADSVEVKPYIAFGANLKSGEKNKVLEQFGISQKELADYETVEVTNQEEHKYLDAYLDSSVIGTRALSSVMIEEADSGSGIHVETHNISFCTKEMYTNALVTAGITDANVTVAAPFKISGTAALVGAMKAYATMTGGEMNEESADAATNELVLTGELGESLGMDKASELVALIKNKVVGGDLSSEQEILDAINEAAKELELTLTDSQKQQLQSLMKKIGGLDLSLDTIKDQAKDIYDKLKGMDIDLDDAKGILDKILDFFKWLFGVIADFFKGLFS